MEDLCGQNQGNPKTPIDGQDGLENNRNICIDLFNKVKHL
jgi:hypothetical protein